MLKKVTLQDIAIDSGLSISTVSRALSRTGKISKEKESKVFESAYRLNYPLSAQHTPIELKNTINIALIAKHYTGEFFASLFEGFDLATTNTKARINLLSVSHSSSSPDYLASYLEKSHFDAAIIFLPDYKADDYRAILSSLPPDFPIVSIAPIVNPVMDTVTFDNYRGGYLVAKHFEELGYTNVGIIQGASHKSEAMLRKNGFLDYVQVSDKMNMVWDYNGDYSFEQGQLAYQIFKDSSVKPDAIFCSNDSMALGFVHDAIRDGVHIPNDLAIAGFDDLPICNLYTPTITSVHTPYELLGKKTLELLFDRLHNDKSTNQTGFTSLVPVTLSVRESSTMLTDVLQTQYK